MDRDNIRELARILRENGLSKLEVTEGNCHVLLEAAAGRAAEGPAASAAAPETPPSPVKEPSSGSGEAPAGLYEQKSPLVGTVYLSPDSTSPVFVTKGGRVKKGDTLCIIESMKMLNDITAEIGGTVRKICVGNEQMAEYGQPLFLIEPEKREENGR